MEPARGTPLTQNLATLQRTHEVYRRARELAGGSEAAEPAANGEEGTPQRAASSGLRDHMERELAASVRQLRSVQAGQQVAAQHAAAEAAQLQATIRDEREKAAQQAAHSQVPRRARETQLAGQEHTSSPPTCPPPQPTPRPIPPTPTPHPCSPRWQEELRQERSRVSKLQSEKQALEMQVAVAEQKAQTQVRRTPPADPATPEESGGSVAAALPARPHESSCPPRCRPAVPAPRRSPTPPLTCPSVQAASAKRELSALQAELLEAASAAEAGAQERDALLAAVEARHEHAPLGGEGGGGGAAPPPSASTANDEQLARLEAAVAQHAAELEEAHARAALLERERDELRKALLAAGREASSGPSRASGAAVAAEHGAKAAAPQSSAAAAGPTAGSGAAAAGGEGGEGEGEPPSTPPKKEKKAAPLTPSAPPSTLLRVPYPVLGADTATMRGAADSKAGAEHALLVLGGGEAPPRQASPTGCCCARCLPRASRSTASRTRAARPSRASLWR